MAVSTSIRKFVEDNEGLAIELLRRLAVIPAPSGHEGRRAEFCMKWLTEQGAEGVFIDDALNVIYPVGCCDGGKLAVFSAHLDTVFPEDEALAVHEADGRIYCPGIGDDTANVVVLMMAAKYIAENHIVPRDHGVLFVLDTGEEGLGNLKGCRRIISSYGDRIASFYSFDCCNYAVSDSAIGSRRYRIELHAEGGHSYFRFGSSNAIHRMALIISDLYGAALPECGRTTYNVGVISGGTSVNTIAEQCQILFEIRSDRMENLDAMSAYLASTLDSHRRDGVEITSEMIGERPCGRNVDMTAQARLSDRARRAIRDNFGAEAVFSPASTDCNIPLSEGIPSICIACYLGDGMHTRDEYVEKSSIAPGMMMALDIISDYFIDT